MGSFATESSSAEGLLSYIDASPSPFHTVATSVALLRSAGFTALRESDNWSTSLTPGGKYFYTRNGSSLIAFALPTNYTPQSSAFAIVGAHTDSPCLKVKPVSKRAAAGYVQLGVECYGGGLWYTWFDRDLTVAGRVFVRRGDAVEVELVHVRRPLLRVPSLAIHLNREVGRDGFNPNKEKHTAPILATEVKEALVGQKGDAEDKGRHSPALLRAVAGEIGCEVGDIMDVELCLADTQPCAIGGVHREFVLAPRLDNLASCYTSLTALVEASAAAERTGAISAVALFDHEEVGSASAHGAGGPLVDELVRRVTKVFSTEEEVLAGVVRRSFLLSADMAHAVHPNYTAKHEDAHRPALHKGVVIKTNSNQRYSTTGVTGLIMRQLAAKAGDLPIQEFVVPNDVPCGSTIGPILSQRSGIRTVDVGLPQLAMHSCREVCGVDDVGYGVQLFATFFKQFTAVDASIKNVEAT